MIYARVGVREWLVVGALAWAASVGLAQAATVCTGVWRVSATSTGAPAVGSTAAYGDDFCGGRGIALASASRVLMYCNLTVNDTHAAEVSMSGFLSTAWATEWDRQGCTSDGGVSDVLKPEQSQTMLCVAAVLGLTFGGYAVGVRR